MADHDHVKPDRTISHNLEDRLGATLDERITAREEGDTERRHVTHLTEPLGGEEPAAPDEGPGSRR
jgi:hypothetical protein